VVKFHQYLGLFKFFFVFISHTSEDWTLDRNNPDAYFSRLAISTICTKLDFAFGA